MTLHEAGIRYMNEQNYEKAAEKFNEAIERNPTDPTGFINFGNLLGIIGEEERALLFFKRAIELDDEAATAYYGAGTILYKQEKFAEAASMYAKAVVHLDEADAHFMLGMSYYQIDRLAHALASFKRTVELMPEDVEGRFQYGLCLAKLGEIDEAITQLEYVVNNDSSHADAYFNLGVAYTYNDRKEDALHAFNQALSIQPDHMLAANGKKVIEEGAPGDRT